MEIIADFLKAKNYRNTVFRQNVEFLSAKPCGTWSNQLALCGWSSGAAQSPLNALNGCLATMYRGHLSFYAPWKSGCGT